MWKSIRITLGSKIKNLENNDIDAMTHQNKYVGGGKKKK